MLDDEVTRMLELLDGGFPRVHEMTGPEARAAVAARAQPVDNLDDVRSAEDVLVPTAEGPVPVRVYRPHGEVDAPLPVVLFFHGGGFVFCSLDSHDGFCRRVAKNTGALVVSVDYRLAPEHRAPAAARDAHAALCWVAENAVELGADPTRIVTMGDSAGGNLAAVVCLMARDLGGPRPAGQVLAYPVIEPDFDTPSYQRYATGHFNTRAAMQWYWEQYLGGADVPEPAAYVAPLRADSHAGLPPAVVVTAGRDPLCSEGESYVAALRRAGVPVRHRHYPELFHGFLTLAAFGPAIAARELLWADVAGLLSHSSERESA
ncbi:alpha/beta hydrolase [Blastococcus sp. SYSU D00820]